MIKVKRIYEKPVKSDGMRILVDRLWPRGLTKEQTKLDYWFKEISPSNELRRWFNHDPNKWLEFKKKYSLELRKKDSQVRQLNQIVEANKNVCFLYGAKDKKHNNALALKEYLDGKI